MKGKIMYSLIQTPIDPSYSRLIDFEISH